MKTPQEICERIRELVEGLEELIYEESRIVGIKNHPIHLENLLQAITRGEKRDYGYWCVVIRNTLGAILAEYDLTKSFLQNLENEALRELLTKVLFEDNGTN